PGGGSGGTGWFGPNALHCRAGMRTACAWALLFLLSSAASQPAWAADATTTTLGYAVEWRLIRAGAAKPRLPSHGEAALLLESVGLVSKLYKVEDSYVGTYEPGFCATSAQMNTSEGKRRRETKVTYDRSRGKANYLEKDLVKNSVVRIEEIDTPGCVHD